ncbi:MAG TPA: hypothetical protein GX695_03335 [Acholeplasmataceae bacterium]|nr:hypothetical protein [Acholeplasmataceae bacterium]
MEDKKLQVNEEQIEVTEQDLLQEQIYEKSLRMQELEALIEQNEYYNEDMLEEKAIDELLISLKKEYKTVKSEIKILKKKTQTSFFDKVPIWLYLYGLVFTIMGFAPVMKKFTEFLAPTAIKVLGEFLYTWFGTFLYLYLPTIILLLITVIIFVIFYKKEVIRKAMYIVLGIHSINAIITIISLIDVFKRLRG